MIPLYLTSLNSKRYVTEFNALLSACPKLISLKIPFARIEDLSPLRNLSSSLIELGANCAGSPSFTLKALSHLIPSLTELKTLTLFWDEHRTQSNQDELESLFTQCVKQLSISSVESLDLALLAKRQIRNADAI